MQDVLSLRTRTPSCTAHGQRQRISVNLYPTSEATTTTTTTHKFMHAGNHRERLIRNADERIRLLSEDYHHDHFWFILEEEFGLVLAVLVSVF
jgi:hypothetical protein